jgi:hypothetical protein
MYIYIYSDSISYIAHHTTASNATSGSCRWCVYELAYWLRLMKMDSSLTRKIKLIPVLRNIGLYDGLPQHQAIVAVMSCVYCALVTLAGTYFHRGGPNSADLGMSLELAVVGGISLCLLIGCAVLFYFIKKDIAPAREQRERVVRDLKRFTWDKAEASNAADKQAVMDMIVTLWAKQLKKKGQVQDMEEKDKSKIIKAFERDVQVGVANRVNELLKSGETQLIIQYVLQILSVIILDGLIIGLIALDYVRPIIAPRYGFWASNNLETSYIIFGIIALCVIVIDMVIFKWVKRKWGVV